MNTFTRLTVLAALFALCVCVTAPVDAQAAKEKFVRDKPHVNATSEEAGEVRKARVRGQKSAGSARLQTAPVKPLSLCCGSVDTESNVGANCAKLAAGKTCGGDILSCPPHCEENVGPDGTGGCHCP